MNLDYSLKDVDSRIQCVNDILANTPNDKLTTQYKTSMADYILFVGGKNQTKKERNSDHSLITKNREITIKKREVSFEDMASSLENGEDGIYQLINNNKNQILDPKEPITAQDIEDIPVLASYLDLVQKLQTQFEKATGTKKYSLKKQIIETWQQIYTTKASVKGINPKGHSNAQMETCPHNITQKPVYLDENGYPQCDGPLSFFDTTQVSYLLTYFLDLKREVADDLQNDLHWIIVDFEKLITRTLADEPVLRDLLSWKIQGFTNDEIQARMLEKYNVVHTNQYFSTLWKNKIPRLIVEQAQKDYIMWYYDKVKPGVWKRCGRCHQLKPAHPLFFSKNNSKDTYYSICKECRNKH